MALWMDDGTAPITESEKADLQAIAAVKESAALELKEQGNQYVKMGKKHYAAAIDCYTRALKQKALSDSDNSILQANRAHVNLLLGNFRRALDDAEEAIRLCTTNVKSGNMCTCFNGRSYGLNLLFKSLVEYQLAFLPFLTWPIASTLLFAHYRAAKAAFCLDLFTEAASLCKGGLEHFPSNEELKKLAVQIDLRKREHESHKAQISKVVGAAKDLASAIESRGLKLGKAMYQELTGVRKPILDENRILHWPVLLLYAEVMSSDFIEDVCESDMLSAHLDMMYSGSCPPLPWDKEHAYTREAIELYFQAGSGFPMSKKEVLQHLLEGTAGALTENVCDDEGDPGHYLYNGKGYGKWAKVNEKKTLHNILQQPDYIIPGIPAFFVVSNRSAFYKEFRAGKWVPP